MKSKKFLTTNVIFSLICIFTFFGCLTDIIIYYRISTACIAIFCIMKGGWSEKWFLNPYILFCLVPISLLIYHNIGDAFMVDLTSSTWLLAIINMVAFIVAIDNTKSCKPCKTDIFYPRINKPPITPVFFLLIVGTSTAYFKAFLGIDLPMAYIFGLISMIGVIIAFASKNKKLIASAILLYLLPTAIGSVSKTIVLTIVLASILCYEKYYMQTSKQRVKLIVTCCIGVIIMINAFTFANKERGSAGHDEQFDNFSSRVEWNTSTALFMPYMYFCTPWANLQYVTETQNERTNGLWLIKPFLGYLQADENFKEKYELTSYSSFNTYTFIAVHYKDFGYWGSLVISFLLGVFIKKVYSRYSISQSPLDCACYLFTAQATIEMFFSNHFFSQSYPFTIIIIVWGYRLLRKQV